MPEIAEIRRLKAYNVATWRKWGPYLSERQWGTVREDFSAVRRSLGLLYPRSGSIESVSHGRGRYRRNIG